MMDSCNSSEFDCNICLDSVQDPVVTLCGHLYCWPCIYRWLHSQAISNEQQQQQQCPVCKADVSEETLVPLFVKCRSTSPTKRKAAPNLQGIIIPRRPLSLACGFSPRSPVTSASTNQPNNFHRPLQSPLHYMQPATRFTSPILRPGSTAGHLFDPVIGVIEEIMYQRDLGNSIANIYNYTDSYNFAGSSPRLRRHMMQADICLSRICFFLFCCVFLCLLLF